MNVGRSSTAPQHTVLLHHKSHCLIQIAKRCHWIDEEDLLNPPLWQYNGKKDEEKIQNMACPVTLSHLFFRDTHSVDIVCWKSWGCTFCILSLCLMLVWYNAMTNTHPQLIVSYCLSIYCESSQQLVLNAVWLNRRAAYIDPLPVCFYTGLGTCFEVNIVWSHFLGCIILSTSRHDIFYKSAKNAIPPSHFLLPVNAISVCSIFYNLVSSDSVEKALKLNLFQFIWLCSELCWVRVGQTGKRGTYRQ